MLNIGMVGLGFMGKAHYGVYRSLAGRANVAAIVDVDEKKRAGDWSAIGGNLDVGSAKVDLAGVKVYADLAPVLADPGIDVVDITLPTYLHADAAVAALRAGKHVVCEKPMAINTAEARRMADAAEQSGKKLFVAQCIRFWPAYARAAEFVKAGTYGAVRSARFVRLSALPRWSWENWLMDNAKGGLAALDLHIHDADFVLYAFGQPKAVSASGLADPSGGYHHILAAYDYGDGRLITAEGGWEHAPEYPFSMTFTIQFEKGTLNCGADGALKYHPDAGGTQLVDVGAQTGYDVELAHFLDCIESGKDSPVVTPESAAASVALVEAEIRAARTGTRVAL